jgi:monoamine oxidase
LILPPAPSNFYDALVLGAGAAGLAAALKLSRAGKRVALIEARDRVGGRIFTQHAALADAADSVPVELGAEFIHGLPTETWRWVREFGLANYELDGAALRFAEGRLRSVEPRSASYSVLKEMTHWFAAQAPGTDETFERYLSHSVLAREPTVREEVIRYVEGFNAADHRVIGVAALNCQQQAEDAIEGDRLFHLQGGYEQLPRALLREFEASGGRSFLTTAISQIHWQPDAVEMSGIDSSGRAVVFRARQAIITLPVGVLQAGSVRFEPAPHRALDAARRMAMGSVIRIPLVFRSRFWRSDAVLSRMPNLADQLRELSFLFADEGLPPTWWTSHPNAAPMLVAWCAGPTTAGINRQRLKESCLAALGTILACPVETLGAELLSWHFHDWDGDPLSRGAYSYMPAGALDASAVISAPVEDTLYFAGEHATQSGHWGTVHGALQSGEASAFALLRA